MSEIDTFQSHDVASLVQTWNRCFRGSPNFIEITEADFIRRVVTVPGFDPAHVLVARQVDRIIGFVHAGPRLEMWDDITPYRIQPEEGHIYALVAPREEQALQRDLLESAVQHVQSLGATRILLTPSWVYGTQSMYNGIAGAYEIPGLSDTRTELINIAEKAGFRLIAEYGTPELELTEELLESVRAKTDEIWKQAREWGMREQIRVLRPSYFPNRKAVMLLRGSEIVAMTAYGPWDEYIRHYRRKLFGITSVQVEPHWRGKGLGKLIMLLALEASRQAGAEAVHLHVYKSNQPAWNLYHRTLGFQPKWRWITLAKG